MLVHRVVVVHIELHLADHPAELRVKPAEHTRLVHPPQSDFRIVSRRQDIHEDRIRTRILPQVLVDKVQGAGNPA